ncbi:MAG TPA: Glu-tRNA(Gln) amidotransferase GatDE subunit D, partial [Acidobacteriota bacterium]|nr:Glu-tRNA(Gln) amidotransferase GatDE subunit D [Acidobacteriota bacterium]
MSAGADQNKGYREPCLSVFRKYGATVWCDVKVKTTRGDFEGLLLPRSETSDELHIVLKLISGYNIGLRHDTILDIVKTGYREAHYQIPEKEFPRDAAKPHVKLL